MSTNIKLKRSSVQGKVPATTDLELGELAINTYDGKLYMKKNDGTDSIVDITSGGASVPSLDSVTGVGNTTNNSITVGGITTTANAIFGDNVKAVFGAGSDLQIYHNGNHSFITDAGTGDLKILGANIEIGSLGAVLNFKGVSDGASTVYHNGSAKLATTSTGVDVTGTALASDSFQTDSSGTGFFVGGGSTGTTAIGKLYNSSGVLTLDTDSTRSIQLATGTTQRLRIDGSTGDISFYEDTGTTAQMTWDASADALTFGDSVKAIFGAGSDLQIYHDGSNSIINDNGTGVLELRTNGTEIQITGNSGTDYMARFISNGAVNLYYDHSLKLATTSTGVDVTGTITSDGLTVDGTTGVSVNGIYANVDLMETDVTDDNTRLISSGGDFRIDTLNDAKNVSTKRLTIDHGTGDISFYEDTGTTAKFFWDASAERLGIGTSSPSEALSVSGNISVTGTVDGVDIAAFKTAYDSHDHDDRYYTETEADSRFVNVTGDTMTGNLVINSGNDADQLQIVRSSPTANQVGMSFAVSGVHERWFGVGTDAEPYWATSANLTGGSKIWTSGNDGASSGLDADLLDGQHGSYYLDWTNTTNKPDPNVTVTLTGDVTGSANTTLTDLANGSISIATTIASNSVALGTDTTGNYAGSVVAGNAITVSGTAGEGTIFTVNHADTSSAANLSSDNANGVVLQDIALTFDTYGHVTAASAATVDLDSRYVNKTGDTMTGVLTINNTNDAQLLLQSTDSWTGIGFNDGATAAPEYIYHNGTNGTFAIGGGGSNVAGKKLHVHGGMTIGSGMASTAMHDTNGLEVEGSIKAPNLQLSSATPTIYFNGTSDGGDGASSDMAIKATPEGLDFYEPEDGSKIHFQILDDTGVNAPFGYKVGTSYVIDTNRDLTVVDGSFSGSVVIDGDLTVNGNTITISANNLSIEDNLIYLNEGSAITNPDLGITGNYNDGTYAHTGVFRDATDGRWKFFKGYTPEPGVSIDTSHTSFALADVQGGTFYGALSGNASTASEWATARTNTVTLTGEVTGSGSASVDGTGNWTVSLATTINNSALNDIYVNKTGDTMTGTLNVTNSSNIVVGTYGTTDTGSLVLTGSTANKQAVLKCTNGNLHIDANAGNAMYLNYYSGTGIAFGNGAAGAVAWMGSDGDLWKGSADNTGDRYFHDGYHPNADKWTTARTNTVTLTGEVTGSGSASVDGTGNWTVSLATTINEGVLDEGAISGTTTWASLINNSVTSAKWLSVTNTTATDRPTNDAGSNAYGYGIGMSINKAGQGALQIYTPEQDGATSGGMFYRSGWNGTIRSWQRLYDDEYKPMADKWTTARTNTVTLTGDATGSGSASVDGSGNWTVSVPVTVANDSHTHSIYVLKAGDTMTGTLSAPQFRLASTGVIDDATATTTATTQVAIDAFSATAYGGSKLLIEAKTGSNRHITELLVTHDGTTAIATEYGAVYTSGVLATYDVDISSGNVRILATPASSTSTSFKVMRTTMFA